MGIRSAWRQFRGLLGLSPVARIFRNFRTRTSLARSILILFFLQFAVACGGPGTGLDPDQNRGGVFIDVPTEFRTITDNSEINFIGTGWTDTSGNYRPVRWSNRTSGQTGTTTASVTYDCNIFFGCQWNYRWDAKVPIQMGDNVLYAEDDYGGRDYVIVTRVIDATPPDVVATSPVADTFDVPLTTTIEVTFSEPIDLASVDSSTFTVKDRPGNLVSGAYSKNGNTIVFSPDASLNDNEDYFVSLSPGAKDMYNNGLAAAYDFQFYTGAGRAPELSWSYPVKNDSCANSAGILMLNFSEPMDYSTMYGAISLQDSASTPVTVAINTLNATTYRVYSPTPLAEGADYTLVVGPTLKDKDGTAVAPGQSFSFTTGYRNTGTWASISSIDAPSPRSHHTAVWTGTEMIVWGGYTGPNTVTSTGARYNPVTDTWQTMSLANAPSPRADHVAVWTGTEMIVWGGINGRDSGGRYDPATDTWSPISNQNALSVEAGHRAVWTGTDMLVWGGYTTGSFGIQYYREGAKYNPDKDQWTLLSTVNSPGELGRHSMVWTGSKAIVLGGQEFWSIGGNFQSVSTYDPFTDSWSTSPLPAGISARLNHESIWTGSEMISWGGYVVDYQHPGVVHSPTSSTWDAVTNACAPPSTMGHTLVWTGSRAIAWGGRVGGGAMYDPVAKSWAAINKANEPASRINHTAVWTGSEMIVWGGDAYDSDTTTVLTGSGGRFTP